MKRLLALALPLLVATTALAQKDELSRSWNQPVEPFRIAGNLYYVGATEITSYLITTPKGHIVIDGGFEETAPLIRASIEKLGFRLADVRYLLNSHAHLDHAGGLAELRRLTGAKFIASAPDTAQLARGGVDDPQFGDIYPFPPIEPDRLIADGGKVTLGGTTLVARITPGHTRGCTTWTMRVREKGKPLDVVFMCSPTAPSPYRLVGNRAYPDAVDDYRKNFAILKSLPCDVFLGAHGGFFDLTGKRQKVGKGANPFIDEVGCKAFVERSEQRIEKLIETQSAKP